MSKFISINSVSDHQPFVSCSETFREQLRQMADKIAAKKAAAEAAKVQIKVAMEMPEQDAEVIDISVSDKGSPAS